MEDRELQGLVRRAKLIPDKTSTSRRSALKQLLDATRSSSVSLKVLAAKNIPDFFQDFPEAEEDAINAVYDLCEDQISQVRMSGYNALVQMSKLEKKWVKRNADVLVQLLQSDDPNEVSMVRKALVEHLQFDARVTLGVLCDQVVPPDDLADPEELAMRDSLRTLVLSFITGELKKGQLVRYMPPGSEAEGTLLDGLISALPKLSESDAQVILKDILMQLHFLDSPSPRGSTLSQSVLQRAKSALYEDHTNADVQNGTRPLNRTRFYFDMLNILFISKKQGDLKDLINFYTPILGKTVFSSIPIEDQVKILHHFAEILRACQTNDPSVIRLLNLTSSFFECLSKTDLTQADVQNTCMVLLRRLLLETDNGWTVPLLVLQSAQSLSRAVPSVGQGGDIHGLIRSLAAKRPESSPKSSTSKTPSAPPMPSTSGASQELSSASPSISILAGPPARNPPPNLTTTLQGGKPLRRKQALDSDNSSHPTKKVKKGGGDSDTIPSLLSRMRTSPSLLAMRSHSSANSHLGQLRHQPRPQLRIQRSESSPIGGLELTIKGAAKKEESLSYSGNETHYRAGPRQAPTVDSSLMNRLTLNDGKVGINPHAHARRNRRRGIA